MNNELDLSNVTTDEELKNVLEQFRKEHKLLITEPAYDNCKWCDENLQKYLESAKTRSTKPTQAQLFYVPETGSIRKNALLISCVVWLKKSHWLSQQNIDQILEYHPPLLRLNCMVERQPGCCEFVEKTFDLVETAINCRAKKVLEQLLPYIDFSYYDQKAIYSILEQT